MANAFHAIVPQSVASTSSSRKPCYDVFINHHGKDVKRTFASVIYQMLDLLGVQTFLDQEELELGEFFPEFIEKAMRSASLHIAIFSPRYANSPWCLEELWLMLQMNVTIIPVFYCVQPNDLRHTTKGIYANAFVQHEKKGRYNLKKIEEWKKALMRVSYLTGCIIVDAHKCDDSLVDEGKLLRKIVETAVHNLKKPQLEFARSPVGLDKAVEDFDEEVQNLERQVGSSTEREIVHIVESEVGTSTWRENVQIVGIVGMGGIGKTTLAIELYNRKSSSFHSKSCFLQNVRDFSKKTLHNLQKNLLEVLGVQHSAFHNMYEGMERLATGLKSMTAMIVLDDVDSVDQMEALLPDRMMRNIGRGSFIIVTTRDVDVLTAWGISSIYNMKLLDPYNAKQLFCRYAFKNGVEHLLDNFSKFEHLVENFVVACNGFPLSLKVVGAMVNGKAEAYWADQLRKMSKILPQEISLCLKLSYDALDREVRQMFLDVACFFIGEKKSMVVAIWNGSGWSDEVGWETLINKCLVGLDKNGNIEMHDHLRDLGREIAGNESPSRIWKEEQINIQERKTPIRGIVAATARPSDPWSSFLHMDTYYPLHLEHFMENIKRQSLSALQLLAVRGNDFREDFATSSRGLVWLRLWDFIGTILPPRLSLANLRVLELYHAQNLEGLWQDNVQPPLQLRELIIDLAERTCFKGLPRSIGHLGLLKKIVINGSGNAMRTLPEEFCHLGSLEILQMSDFSMLSSLPNNFGHLKNLRVLIFSGVQLTTLPDSFNQLKLLELLDISNSKSFFFASDMLHVLEFMTKLQTLRISYCPQLVELPHLTTQVPLRELKLTYTGLRNIPDNIGQLTKLETLVIGSDFLTSLPISLGELSRLTSLAIYDCHLLQSLPEAVGYLSNLQSLDIHTTPVVELGFGKGPPSGCNLRSLKCLSLFNTRVSTILISDSCCPNLEILQLSCNTQLTSIRGLPKNLREIIVHGCEKMLKMIGISDLRDLENLVITDCPKLVLPQIPAYMVSVRGRIRITGCPKAYVGILGDDEVIETATQSRLFSDEGEVSRVIEDVFIDVGEMPREFEVSRDIEDTPMNKNRSGQRLLQKISHQMPKKKIVLKVSELHCEKCRRRVKKAVAGVSGVESVQADPKDNKITVIGDADPVEITAKLRKYGSSEILSVGQAKDEKKDDKKMKRRISPQLLYQT